MLTSSKLKIRIIYWGLGMKITREEVEHVALLARLKFEEEEKERFTTQLNSILAYMEKLGRLDTQGVEPTFHAVAQTNAFRDDAVGPSLPRDLSLSNAPEKDNGFFRVPKIIE
jgi:aspartyl-tRNA(Asn)/glutamyl-tRNA(Gln) amidotransferase subunit C